MPERVQTWSVLKIASEVIENYRTDKFPPIPLLGKGLSLLVVLLQVLYEYLPVAPEVGFVPCLYDICHDLVEFIKGQRTQC